MSIIVPEQKTNFNTFFEKLNGSKRYFKIPMSFFDTTSKIYKISNSAKILYSLMLDLTTLSAKNKLYDEQGNIYIFFTRKKAMDYLNCSSATTCKIFKELKKYHLIYEKRQGFKKANKIYIKNFYTDENKNIITNFINIDKSKVVKLSEEKNIKVNYLLFTDAQISGILSNDAKVLYSLLLYRNSLSIKKNFVDKNGRICINFKRKEAQEFLNCSKDKISRIFKELSDNDLIKEIRQRLTLPNIIYLSDFIDNKKSENNYMENHKTQAEQSAEILDCFEDCKKNSEILKEEIKNQIQYDYLEILISKYDNPNFEILDKIINVIYYVKTTKKQHLKIDGKFMPVCNISFGIIEVKALHIFKIYAKYIEKSANEEIRKPESYILTMLYNSISEMKSEDRYKYYIRRYGDEFAQEKIKFVANEFVKNGYTQEIKELLNLLNSTEYVQKYILQYSDSNWDKISDIIIQQSL